MKKIKLMAIVLSLMFVCSVFSQWELPVIAENNDNQYAMGLLDDDLEELEQYEDTTTLSQSDIESLAARHDLTEEYPEYIPPIINQGHFYSCVPSALVYYAYTYAANKLNKIPTTESNAYSPKWAYNALNKANPFIGTSELDVLLFLSEHGSLKQKDFPYIADLSNSQNYTELPSAELATEMLEALETRVIAKNMQFNDFRKTTDSFIDKIKLEISNGNMVGVSTRMKAWDSVYVNDTVGYVGIRTSTTLTDGTAAQGHAVVIVGYDDDLWVDINQNNKKDKGEFGAFKLANSWGSDWELTPIDADGEDDGHVADGYYWIAYDSLYKTSNVDNGDWEEDRCYTNKRLVAFSRGISSTNGAYKIHVEKYEIDYAVQIIVNAPERNNIHVYIGSSTENPVPSNKIKNKYYPSVRIGSSPCTNLAFIYAIDAPLTTDTFVNRKEYLLDHFYNYIQVNGSKSVDIDIVDNRGNRVNTDTLSFDISTQSIIYRNYAVQKMGDLNYNGFVDRDDLYLMYLQANAPRGVDYLSNVQTYLGDINKNSKVDMDDFHQFGGDETIFSLSNAYNNSVQKRRM